MYRLTLALLLVLTASEARAQSVVQGKVVNADSVAIAGARVQVSDSVDHIYETVTDSAGNFRIRLAHPLRPGLFFVRAEMLGYRTLANVPLQINQLDDVTILLRMDVAAIPLEPLRVSARARYTRGPRDEYLDRADRVKRFGGGIIIDAQELERRSVTNVALLMSERMPSMRNCPPSVFVDGMRATSDDLRTLQASMLEGVEIYRSATLVPVQYQNRSGCGAVLIWTQIGDRGRGSPLTWRRVAMTLGLITIGVLFLR